MKDRPCPRTVFSQTQKIKNVWLKRRFQFVGRRKLQIENPSPFARKEFAYFYAPFRSRPALFHFAKTRPAFAPLRFKKANTFPPLLIFAREQKCIINHSGLGICAGMVVTNTAFVLEKFLINVFLLKNFFISSLKFY